MLFRAHRELVGGLSCGVAFKESARSRAQKWAGREKSPIGPCPSSLHMAQGTAINPGFLLVGLSSICDQYAPLRSVFQLSQPPPVACFGHYCAASSPGPDAKFTQLPVPSASDTGGCPSMASRPRDQFHGASWCSRSAFTVSSVAVAPGHKGRLAGPNSASFSH